MVQNPNGVISYIQNQPQMAQMNQGLVTLVPTKAGMMPTLQQTMAQTMAPTFPYMPTVVYPQMGSYVLPQQMLPQIAMPQQIMTQTVQMRHMNPPQIKTHKPGHHKDTNLLTPAVSLSVKAEINEENTFSPTATDSSKFAVIKEVRRKKPQKLNFKTKDLNNRSSKHSSSNRKNKPSSKKRTSKSKSPRRDSWGRFKSSKSRSRSYSRSSRSRSRSTRSRSKSGSRSRSASSRSFSGSSRSRSYSRSRSRSYDRKKFKKRSRALTSLFSSD